MGAGQVGGGQAKVLVGRALAVVPAGKNRVAPGGVNPAGGAVQPGQVPGVIFSPGLAGDIGGVDAQLVAQVLKGLGIAAAQPRPVDHDVDDGIVVHHLIVGVGNEVGIDAQGLVILRARLGQGGQAVGRPLVDLGLGGLPLALVHGVHRPVDRPDGGVRQQGGLDLSGAREPKQLGVVLVDGGDGPLDHLRVRVEVVDGLRLVLQAGQQLVIYIALLAAEGALGPAEAVFLPHVVGGGFRHRHLAHHLRQGELAPGQQAQTQAQRQQPGEGACHGPHPFRARQASTARTMAAALRP